MGKFEDSVNGAIQNGIIPGLVVCAENRDGTLNYSMTFEGPSKSYQEDTILELASLTKLLTAIAALQQVEKGVVSLEEDVSHLIPAFSNQKVLHSDPTDEKKILVKDRTQPITFEGLLTHSAGAGYPFTDTRLEKYTNTTGYPTGSVDAAFDFPLSYEPGTSWLYGHSMDRVGQVLEKITGKDLEELFQEGILKPLGITNASFYSLPHPRMAVRKEPGARAVPDPAAHSFTRGNIEAFGGQGLLMPMNDYIKVLQSLLRNDGALLEPETVDLLFQPRLGARPRAGLLKQLENPEWAVGDLPRTGEYDWSIGGLVITGDSHRYRQRDTVLWSGAPSCFWFLDRRSGVCGVFGTQVLPACDPEVKPLITAFEEEVYRRARGLLECQDSRRA